MCGYSTDSIEHTRIYKPSARKTVESHNVAFLETPPSNMPPSWDSAAFDAYFSDVLSFFPQPSATHWSTQINDEEALKSMQLVIALTKKQRHHQSPSIIFQLMIHSVHHHHCHLMAAFCRPSRRPLLRKTGVGAAPATPTASRVPRVSTMNTPTTENMDAHGFTAAKRPAIEGLSYNTIRRPQVDFGRIREHITPPAFACAAGSPIDSGFSGRKNNELIS